MKIILLLHFDIPVKLGGQKVGFAHRAFNETDYEINVAVVIQF